MRTRFLHLVSLAVVIAVVIGATWVWAQENDTTYYACVNKTSGAIKVFMEETPCSANETPILWNQTGPPGPSGVSQAFTTNRGDIVISSTDDVDVVALDLPAGIFVGNITLQMSSTGRAFLGCRYDKIVDGVRSELGGWRFGGSVNNQMETHAHTVGINLDEASKVVVTCMPWLGDSGLESITLHSNSWTVLQVDSLDRQHNNLP